MRHLARKRSAARAAAAVGPNRIVYEVLFKFRWIAQLLRYPVHISMAQEDHAHRGIAEIASGLHQGGQNGIQIECRAADDLEHVGGRGLLLQRLVQLTDETRVLDSD